MSDTEIKSNSDTDSNTNNNTNTNTDATSDVDGLDSLWPPENINDLDKLVRQIFKIIPSYYEPDEAKEIRQLILDYVNGLK